MLQGGKYRILRVLGHGGFGITYEAEQVALGRQVAVKEFFMKDNCEREGDETSVSVPSAAVRPLVEKFRGKFIREARMIAGFRHPGIVRVTDVFEENETAYYVMDYLPGGSLSDKVKAAGKLTEEAALSYIRQISEALSYIHGKNTLHLDVKPANVMLDESNRPVLVDFGVSKHYDEAGEQTSSTPVALSAGYAPLEQSKAGDVAKMQPATDIYALGATLYFLISGQNPPDAADVYEDGLKRPKGISDTLWAAIEKAMAPRRKDRPQSVEDFLSLLAKRDIPAQDNTTSRIEETVIRLTDKGDSPTGKKRDNKRNPSTL